ncbi:SPX domain-containing protein [Echria macrotheca]|uniref:SPX domain-containing protein n=1 Tax=Echria macrotheca TaxID=438768 RepID=A0AAJ0B855_9PEZI|nr:SPX domain-containing protein [Echria macrotheca]
MKFGHSFQEALKGESYPQHWVDKAIPYRQLKKILANVREELINKGYDPETIHRLLAEHRAKYSLESGESHLLRPRLIVQPAPSTPTLTLQEPPLEPESEAESGTQGHAPENDGHGTLDVEGGEADEASWVKVPLDSDRKFFNILQTDVDELDSLQSEERKSMNDKIAALGYEIAEVAKPKKKIQISGSDLYRWREIFELYLTAQVFFSTSEFTSGARNSENARKQLVWFQGELEKRRIVQYFKLEASINAYKRFLELNATLLRNVQFQELNQTAVVKIIKKFDKQTSLGVKTRFPQALQPTHFIAESIAKDVCAQISSEVLAIVPQVADYTCTICLSICWLPILLDCDHRFCIRCMIKMQNRNKRYCPLCRANTVLNATDINIDTQMMKFLEKWFPKEVKEKQAVNEQDRRKELFGVLVDDTPPSCCVM